MEHVAYIKEIRNMCILVHNLKEWDHLDNWAVNGRIILKQIFKRCYVVLKSHIPWQYARGTKLNNNNNNNKLQKTAILGTMHIHRNVLM
jgi:hypothetical protein